MKKTAIILGAFLLLTIGVMVTIYTVRKSKIEEQYVSESSTSVLSFAIDDLLLDNISSLITFNKSSSNEVKESDDWSKKIIWNAGISIPARMYLFTLPQSDKQFYGIIDIKNYDNCFSFFATYFPDSINFIDKEQEIVSVAISKHLKIVFNRSHLVYQLTGQNNADFKELQTLLQTPTSWSKVGSLKGFEYAYALSKKHISYVQKDRMLKIEAMVSKNKTEIDGEWVLSQSLKDNFLIREMDTTNQTIRFWSLLPLEEIPALSYFMTKYTGLNQEKLIANYSNYFDLQLKDDLITQRDSSITYSYDDDFNEIEEISIQEQTVPSITLTWKYNALLKDSLPTSMFYKFQKKKIDQYLINTTSETSIYPTTSENTLYPLYCSIDFGTWPEAWSISVFKKLKKAKAKVNVVTTLKNEKTLFIKGEITY